MFVSIRTTVKIHTLGPVGPTVVCLVLQQEILSCTNIERGQERMHNASTASEEDGTSPPLTSQRDGVTGRSRRRRKRRRSQRGGTETHLSDSECLLSREY